MLYGVKVLNYLKGTMNLLIFNKKSEATIAQDILDSFWETDALKSLCDEAISNEYQLVFEGAKAYEEELNRKTLLEVMKDFPYTVNNDGHVSTEYSNVRIVNYSSYVTIPS